MFGVMIVLALIMGGCLVLVSSCATHVVKDNQNATEYGQRFVSVQVTKFANTGGSYSRVEGSVTNNGEKTITFWKVTLQYKDARESVLDSGTRLSFQTLRPGEAQKFEELHKDDPQIVNVGVRLEEVRLKP
jgi:hypothetical protein